MSTTGTPYRGRGVFGERATLARAMAEALAEKGFGLDIGMGVFEIAVDRVVAAQAAYVDEATEQAKLPRIDAPTRAI